MSKKTYSEKLKDPRWQRKRLEVMERDEFHCRMCGDGESTLHVHHKRYVKGREPWEYELHELATVCENCHEQAHELMNGISAVAVRFDIDGGPWSIENATALLSGYFDGHLTARQREPELWKNTGLSPEMYLLGRVCGELQEPPTQADYRKHLSSILLLSDIVRDKGSAWLFDVLAKAIKAEGV